MILALSSVIALSIAFLSRHNRLLALAVLLFLLPTYLIRFSIGGIPFTLLEFMLLSIVAFWCIDGGVATLIHTTKTRTGRTLYALVGLIIIASIFGLLVAPDLRTAAGLWKAYIIEPVALFFVIIDTVRSKAQYLFLCKALILAGTLVALITLIQYSTGWAIPEPWNLLPSRRATAFFGYPNAVGLYLAPIAAVAVSLLLHGSATFSSRILLLMSIVLMSLALLAARVDGAIVALTVTTVVLLLCTRWKWVVAGFTVVAGMVALYIPHIRAILLFQDTSGDVRLALWKGTTSLLMHQPLFGSGLGGFPATYDIYRLPSHVELLQYPHFFLFNFWTELGILGALWIIIVLTCMAATAWLNRHTQRTLAMVLISVVISFVVYGLVDVPYFKNDLSILFWVWLSIAWFLYTEQQKRPKKSA